MENNLQVSDKSLSIAKYLENYHSRKNAPMYSTSQISDNLYPEVKDWLISARNTFGQSTFSRLLIIINSSPYIEKLIQEDPNFATTCLNKNYKSILDVLHHEIRDTAQKTENKQDVQKILRKYKRKCILTTALADLSNGISCQEAMQILSTIADISLTIAYNKALTYAFTKQKITSCDSKKVGLFIIAMGKYGAKELNYSSDIDIIFLYDELSNCILNPVKTKQVYQAICKDIIDIMSTITTDGYVFRIDIRLKPSFASLGVCLSISSALQYYENHGEFWERAAYIKARIICGNILAGKYFLKTISPFVWRKHLDFASLQEIHEVKQKIHKHHGFISKDDLNHNIKLGRGGIRDIEFFTQAQQLITGGRNQKLRPAQTITALYKLMNAQWISKTACSELCNAYIFLRRLEHSIQLVHDLQTHTLPLVDEELTSVSNLFGYETKDQLKKELLRTTNIVRKHYAMLFEDNPTDCSSTINKQLIDPNKIEKVLQSLNFPYLKEAATILLKWYKQSYRATFHKKSRNMLIYALPNILSSCLACHKPLNALKKYDHLISILPSCTQLFSILSQNKQLAILLGNILSESQSLANIILQKPSILDVLIDPESFNTELTPGTLEAWFNRVETNEIDFESILNISRRLNKELSFLISLRYLSGLIDAYSFSLHLSHMAEQLIIILLSHTLHEIENKYDSLPGLQIAIFAMGKLGNREMTINSDLDIVIFHYVPQNNHGTNTYINRVVRKLVAALQAPTSEGSIYQVDLRLRPWGNSSNLSITPESLNKYLNSHLRPWELMALTKARFIAGNKKLSMLIQDMIINKLSTSQKIEHLQQWILDSRRKIYNQSQKNGIFGIKNIKGGVIDLEFIIQYILLTKGVFNTKLIGVNTYELLKILSQHKAIKADASIKNTLEKLKECHRFYIAISQVEALASLNNRFQYNTSQIEKITILSKLLQKSQYQLTPQEIITMVHMYTNIINSIFTRLIGSY